MAKSHMKPSIAFDTTPMLWGVRDQEDEFKMVEHTKRYIKKLENDGYYILVPTPVVAEYLVGATATQFKEAQILRRGFLIADLDPEAAILAAKMQRGGNVEIIHGEYGIPKQNIRIDSFIIAIAITNGSKKIITHNKEEFEILAEGQPIKVDSVPKVEKPGDMFGMFEEGEAEAEA